MKSFGPLKISGKYKIKTNYCFASTVQVQVNTRCKRAPEIESILGDFNITFFRFPKILSLKLFDLGFFEAAEDDFPFSLDTSASERVSSVSCYQQLLVALWEERKVTNY